jgi:hypothetical protein
VGCSFRRPFGDLSRQRHANHNQWLTPISLDDQHVAFVEPAIEVAEPIASAFTSTQRSRPISERSIVKALLGKGIAAVRVPLSGAAGGRFADDIVLPVRAPLLRERRPLMRPPGAGAALAL